MKYKIGQRMVNSYMICDEEELESQEDDAEIVCLAILGDGSWKYGVHNDSDEYSDEIELLTEEELEDEYIIREVK